MKEQKQFFRTYETPKNEFNRVQSEPQTLNTLHLVTDDDDMARGLLMPSARITIEDEDPEARIFTIEDRKRMNDYTSKLITQLNQQNDGLDEINEGKELDDESLVEEQPLKLKSLETSDRSLEKTLIKRKDLSITLSEIQKNNKSDSMTDSNLGNVEADEYEDYEDPKMNTKKDLRIELMQGLQELKELTITNEPDDELGSNLDEDLQVIGRLEDI